MPADVVQTFNAFDVELPPPYQTFTNPVMDGGVLVSFQTWTPSYWILTLFDIDNVITGTTLTLPDNEDGHIPYALGYSTAYTSSSIGAVRETPSPPRIFIGNAQIGIELSGVNQFDSVNYTAGTSTSPITGSLTTSDGLSYSISTSNSYPNWYSSMICFTLQSGTKQFKIVLAFLVTSDATTGGITETIDGWTYLLGNTYNGVYYQVAESQIMQFQYPNGDPVANGYLLVSIDTDTQAPNDAGQLTAGRVSKVPLDENGMASNFIPYSNVDMLPANSSYIVRVYSPSGELIRGPYPVQAQTSWL